jgi:flagellin
MVNCSLGAIIAGTGTGVAFDLPEQKLASAKCRRPSRNEGTTMPVGSVNTNSSAAVALFNLNSTSNSLNVTQNRISTGLKVASTKDDSSIYQIAQNLRGDLGGLTAVRSSLDRAKSTLDVTVSAAESVSDLLVRARELAVNLADTGIDNNSRTAIASDFKKVTEQIDSIVGQAQFNGVNLLKASPDQISAITSVSPGSAVSRLNVSGQALGSKSASATFVSTATTVAVAAGDNLGTLATVDGGKVATAIAAFATTGGVSFDDATGKFSVDSTGTGYVAATGVVSISIGGRAFTATAAKGATGTFELDASAFTATAAGSLTVTAVNAADGKNVGGLDLTKFSGRSQALGYVDNYATNVKNFLSNLGSASRQLDLQISFADKLKQSVNEGIGNLVDANLSEESARYQSLQVKQQLGTQALSIANQGPQTLLSLFR